MSDRASFRTNEQSTRAVSGNCGIICFSALMRAVLRWENRLLVLEGGLGKMQARSKRAGFWNTLATCSRLPYDDAPAARRSFLSLASALPRSFPLPRIFGSLGTGPLAKEKRAPSFALGDPAKGKGPSLGSQKACGRFCGRSPFPTMQNPAS